MFSARLRRQDGFIREILWMALAIAVVAIVLLDAMALFNAHQTVHDNASMAAKGAREEFVQTSNAAQAEAVAKQYLVKKGDKLIGFSSGPGLEGNMVFTVEAQGHANTRAFHFLSYLGLKKWVDTMTNPTASETSD